ncbi:hypothetical protein VTL71DRAFT_5855 [Oculimacula yallundae]|uniref:Nephrocystin 3-like N-terminal domain-containing protein n=1 Tax=Oculimacula yallundae TaxID=86028 RepID=A0ABR4C180_9HELO
MDPGTALAVVGLALDGIKDVYAYYTVWKDRDADIAEIRSALFWLEGLFKAIRTTLVNKNHNKDQVELICKSVESCRTIIDHLGKKLTKVKDEAPPETVMAKLSDQARKAMYPFKKGTIMKLLDSTEKIRDQMNDVIRLLNLRVFVNYHLDFLISPTGLEYEKLLTWLNPTDQSEIHAAALRKHETGTGQWLLRSGIFRAWKQDAGTSLHLFGEAGCGKTVLFSSIVRSIQGTQQPLKINSNSAYFYCRFDNGAQHELGPILRALIAQLCNRNPISAPLKQLFDHHNRHFPPGVPSDDELKATLLLLLQAMNGETSGSATGQTPTIEPRYLLFDALDELPLGSSRNNIIAYLNQLATMRIPNLHLLATSRNESDIRVGLGAWNTSLLIDKEKVEKDMRVHVMNEIQNDVGLCQQKDDIKELILQCLVDRGNGMFRWASLQLEELKILRPMKARSIKKVLQTLPKDLDETYERVLMRIPAGNTREALSVLRWISFASRPLYIDEIMDVCAIQLDDDPEFDADERYSSDNIFDMLPALITVGPKFNDPSKPNYCFSDTVIFTHFSVQEYLTGSRIGSGPAQKYALEAVYSNHFIARSSIAYLTCCNTYESRKHDFPLREYAWDHWPWHASFEPGKRIEEVNADAEVLAISIRHPNREQSQLALEKLSHRLSYVAEWQNMAHLPGSDRGNALRLPFFYPEFAVHWAEESKTRKEPLTLYDFSVLENPQTDAYKILLYPSNNLYTEIRCRTRAMIGPSVSENWELYRLDLDDSAFVRVNGLLLQVPKIMAELFRENERYREPSSFWIERLDDGSGFKLQQLDAGQSKPVWRLIETRFGQAIRLLRKRKGEEGDE